MCLGMPFAPFAMFTLQSFLQILINFKLGLILSTNTFALVLLAMCFSSWTHLAFLSCVIDKRRGMAQ